MQNVVLGAYGYDLTHSSTFVGVIIFAQLGPALLLAMVGGLIADKVDRKKFSSFSPSNNCCSHSSWPGW